MKYKKISVIIGLVVLLLLSSCVGDPLIVETTNGIPGPAGADGAPGINGAGVILNEPGEANKVLTSFDNATGVFTLQQLTTDNISGLVAALLAKQETSEKGVANGYASLNATGKVPSSQIDFPAGGGSVNSVSGSGQIQSTGGTDPVISMLPLGSQNVTDALGYIPTNNGTRNAANGFPGLDATNNITSSIADANQIKGGSSNQIIKWVGAVATWYSVLQADIVTWLGFSPADNATAIAHYNNVSNPHSVTANQVLPDQTGNATKFLQTDGSNVQWTAGGAAGVNSVSGSGQIQSTGGSDPVISMLPLTSANITTALSFNPADNATAVLSVQAGGQLTSSGGQNPVIQMSALSSQNITDALTYTPENPANKNIANGYPGLDATNNITASIADGSQIKGGIAGQFLKALVGWYTIVQADVLAWLGYTPENVANKGVANGYAPLGAASTVPPINLGAGVADATTFLDGTGNWSAPTASAAWGSITGDISAQADLQSQHVTMNSTIAGKVASVGAQGALVSSGGVNPVIQWSAPLNSGNITTALSYTPLNSANVTATATAGLVPVMDANKTVDNAVSRGMTVILIAPETNLVTGNSTFHWTVPAMLNGMNLVKVESSVETVSSSGLPTFNVLNSTDNTTMLSTASTIDANEYSSATAATPSVVDTSFDDVVTGDRLGFNCSVTGTGTKGWQMTLTFRFP